MKLVAYCSRCCSRNTGLTLSMNCETEFLACVSSGKWRHEWISNKVRSESNM